MRTLFLTLFSVFTLSFVAKANFSTNLPIGNDCNLLLNGNLDNNVDNWSSWETSLNFHAHEMEIRDINTVTFPWNACNDNNASINPNAVEIANNGIDENCDGTDLIIDNGDPNDVDNDGFPAGEDCDDLLSYVNPNAVEIPNNDVDENCDGIVLITNEIETQDPFSIFIHLDQFGYENNAEKVAVISNPQVGFNSSVAYTPGNTMQVRAVSSNEVVFSAAPQIWNNGATHTQSGDQGWWFDFSSVTTSGTYYVVDPSTGHRTAPFEINENPFVEVLQATTKMFYYNRCGTDKVAPYVGTDWVDGTNFLQDVRVRDIYDRNNPATEKDMSGGWFDAGDYNKYVTFTHNTLHQLFSAYQDNPTVFTDNWNIPESGDGIPDILNEIQWELDWLFKMVNPDGSAHIKIGSSEYALNYNAPPSNNFVPRFYAPTCSSASLSVASTNARAAKIFEEIPALRAYAQRLDSNAILCWNYYLPFHNAQNWQTDCDDQSVKAGPADWSVQIQQNNAIVAAVYLYDLTGDTRYSNFVAANIENAQPLIQNGIGSEHAVLSEALLYYTTLNGANPTTVDRILGFYANQIQANFQDVYNFSENDLYRAQMPDWAYYWGSNMLKANYGNLCRLFAKYNVVPSANAGLRRKAAEQLHYFHGVNPSGLVHLSNMYEYGGDRCADEIFHTWFNEGTPWDRNPAPGFLVGGSNQFYSGVLSPPADQPAQKSYWDFNYDVFQSYEITEPAIYYQAAYLQLLSNYITNGDPNPTEEVTCNALSNGDFDNNVNDWGFWSCIAVANSGALEINSIVTGENPWDASVFQADLNLEAGAIYTLSFDARAVANRNMDVKVGLADAPFTAFFYESVNLTTQMQSYNFTFTMPDPITGIVAFNFFVGENSASILVDNVNLQIASCQFTNMLTSISSSLKVTEEITLFPNPTSGNLTIQLPANQYSKMETIEIMDVWGRIVETRQLQLTTNTALEVSNLMDGIYFMKIGEGLHRFVVLKN